MRSQVVLGVAVAGLLLVGGVSCGQWATSPTGPASPAVSPAASASGTPAASASPAGRSLSFVDLLAGILDLEKSPVPLTRDQAVRIGQALDGQAPDFRLDAWLTAQAAEILTADQKKFLASHGRFRPTLEAERAALLEELRRAAGADQAAPFSVPDPLPPADKPELECLSLLVTEFGSLQGEKGLALTQDQAKRLLPLCTEYVSLDGTIEGVLGAILTPEQKDYISKNAREGGLKPDIDALVRQVRDLLSARSKP